MKFSGMRSRLAARLKPGKRSGDTGDTDQAFEGIASTSRQQKDSALMRMPPEIRCLILENLWNDAGAVQHIILQNGRYTSKKCVTNHSAPGDLMQECAEHQSTRFQDEALWSRMTSAWGNHWKCEEFHRDGEPKGWSPFLTMMLVCKQMQVPLDLIITTTFPAPSLSSLQVYRVPYLCIQSAHPCDSRHRDAVQFHRIPASAYYQPYSEFEHSDASSRTPGVEVENESRSNIHHVPLAQLLSGHGSAAEPGCGRHVAGHGRACLASRVERDTGTECEPICV